MPPAAAVAGDFKGGGLAGPGLVGGFDAIAPGAGTAAAAGELSGEGDATADGGGLPAFAEATAPGDAAAPCGAGLAPLDGRRAFFFLWRPCADVREVLAHAHLPK